MAAAGSAAQKKRQTGCAPARLAAPVPPPALDFLARARELAPMALTPLGLELVLAEISRDEDGRLVLRCFIDRRWPGPEAGAEPGCSGVSLDDCSAASRSLESLLDADELPQPEGYVLEVSSPGLDRPLFGASDYQRFAGRLVRLKLRRGGRCLTRRGRLLCAENGALALETAEERLSFDLAEVASCRLSPEVTDF